MIDWNPLTKRLQYVLSLKATPMNRLYQNVGLIVNEDFHLHEFDLVSQCIERSISY